MPERAPRPRLARAELLARRDAFLAARRSRPSLPAAAAALACAAAAVSALGGAAGIVLVLAGSAALAWRSVRRMERGMRAAGLVCRRCDGLLHVDRVRLGRLLRTGRCPWCTRRVLAPVRAARRRR